MIFRLYLLLCFLLGVLVWYLKDAPARNPSVRISLMGMTFFWFLLDLALYLAFLALLWVYSGQICWRLTCGI